ncbi:MAG: hypothetical protein CBB68_13835 [Rhodospirillaceae bacterium TMED8]|nr:hypothetical protein [Magnetovibrio sp.]OUT48320.1 MAG: hypothetical protein CBB68_13835 [Rhodospirillaceae bacterium TMED8]|tara:strand:- start:767 stop:1480 length:714 start_codon:yes stop_codon:yes gene_type:complete
MKTLNISTRLLSEAVWRRIFDNAAPRYMQKRQSFFDLMASLDLLRKGAEYNTGSISTSSAWALYSVAGLFQPEKVLEVGTFIGKSTMAIATGMHDSGLQNGILHTCDLSNAIELPNTTNVKITQHKKTSSTEMFRQIQLSHNNKHQFQFIHLDGRLQNDDIPILAKICSTDIVIALDDFEGFEKGTFNFANMQAANILTDHILIYPPSEALLRDFGFVDHSTTALLLHKNTIDFTPQ